MRNLRRASWVWTRLSTELSVAASRQAALDLGARLPRLCGGESGDNLGRTHLRINAGTEGHVTSGGEFQVQYVAANGDHDEQREAWKQYGLDLGVGVDPISTQEARVHYQLSFEKSRAGR